MTKTDEQYQEELNAWNVIKDIELPGMDESAPEDIVEGTNITMLDARKLKAEGGPEEPMRLLDTQAQIAMLQEVLSMALGKIEQLELKVEELSK